MLVLEKLFIKILLFSIILPIGKMPFGNIFVHDIVLMVCILISTLRSRSLKIHRGLTLFFFLICFSYLPGTIISHNPIEYFTSIPQIILIYFFLNYFSLIAKERVVKLDDLIVFLRFSLLFANAYCIAIFLGHVDYQEKIVWVAGRFSGTYGNPNLYAKILSLNIVLIWSLVKKFTIIDFIIVMTSVLLIFSTASASGLIYLSIASCILLGSIIFYGTNGERVTVSALIILFTYFVQKSQILTDNLFQFFDVVSRRVFEKSNLTEVGSSAEKFKQLVSGFEVAIANLPFGVGIENGKFHNAESFLIHGEPVAFHWYFTTISVEGGIPVLCLIIFGISVLLKKSLHVDHKAFILMMFYVFVFIISTNIFNRFMLLIPAITIFRYSLIERK